MKAKTPQDLEGQVDEVLIEFLAEAGGEVSRLAYDNAKNRLTHLIEDYVVAARIEPAEFKAWILDRLAQYDQENPRWQYYGEALEFVNNIPMPPDGKYKHLLDSSVGD